MPPPANPDASTLGVTTLNCGMIAENAFTNKNKGQHEKLAQLANIVCGWLLDSGPNVVGLNEMHPELAAKVVADIRKKVPAVKHESLDSDTLIWRTP